MLRTSSEYRNDETYFQPLAYLVKQHPDAATLFYRSVLPDKVQQLLHGIHPAL